MPDLVVCDIHLPRLDGYGVASQLKSDPSLRHIPLIAVTALAMAGDHERVLKAGFDAYITKPIDPQSFVKQIESHLVPHQRADAPAAAAGRADGAQTRPPTRARVVVVDDLPANHLLLRSLLEPSGYAVIPAGTAHEGLAVTRSTRPDMIISDLHMPDTTGVELLRWVKADPDLKEIPFVLITSSAWGEHDRESAYALGAAMFIVRPIEPPKLLAEIERCLKLTGSS